ncbi:ORF6C domain-containing protein [Clostridium perfringens]
MNNLINVQVNEQGKQIVSAKNLYLGLGLNKSQWSRWYKANIENNDFFEENVDWAGVRHDVEGNETMDFAITLEFAKHIAMMAKTEKSHEYRNYFIECEKQLSSGQTTKQLSAREKLELHYQFSEENAKRIDSLEQELEDTKNDFKEFQQDLPLIGAEPEELQKVVRRVGTSALGGHGSPAYKDKSLSAKVYKNVWKFVKEQFNVNTYKAIKRKHLSKAKEIAENYTLPFYLQEEIELINSQGQLNI